MDKNARKVRPLHVAFFIALFFVAYGVYAMWLGGQSHPVYAAGSWTLAVLWFTLAWMSRKGTRQ